MKKIECVSFYKKLLSTLKESIKKTDNGKLVVILTREENSKIILEKINKELNVNIEFVDCIYKMPEYIYSAITSFNEDSQCKGIYIDTLDTRLKKEASIIYTMVHPTKDIAAMNVVNLGLQQFNNYRIRLPIISAVIYCLEQSNINIEGKFVAIVNRNIGKQFAFAILEKNGTPVICHSKTRKLINIMKSADIVISSTGKIDFVRRTMLKKDAIVFDIGYHNINGKVFGDVFIDDINDLNITLATSNELHWLEQLFVFYNYIVLNKK